MFIEIFTISKHKCTSTPEVKINCFPPFCAGTSRLIKIMDCLEVVLIY